MGEMGAGRVGERREQLGGDGVEHRPDMYSAQRVYPPPLHTHLLLQYQLLLPAVFTDLAAMLTQAFMHAALPCSEYNSRSSPDHSLAQPPTHPHTH